MFYASKLSGAWIVFLLVVNVSFVYSDKLSMNGVSFIVDGLFILTSLFINVFCFIFVKYAD